MSDSLKRELSNYKFIIKASYITKLLIKDIKMTIKRISLYLWAILIGLIGLMGFGFTSIASAADLTVSGTPEVGETLTFSIDREGSVNARLMQSPLLSLPPVRIGNLGFIYLSRDLMEFLPQDVTTNWGGLSTITDVEVYIDPAKYSVGDVMHFQGLQIGPWLVLEGFTNDYISITVQGNSGIAVPQNVQASDGKEQIKITWNTPLSGTGPEHYYIYRSSTSDVLNNGELIGETIGTETFFVDTEATLAQTFWYGVRAKGNSQLSNTDQGRVSSIKGMKWSYEYDHFLDATIGNNGSKVFATSEFGPWIDSFIFSLSDSNPPTPVVPYSTYPNIMTNWYGVGSASRSADLFADARVSGLNSSSFKGNFRLYSSQSALPLFEYVSPIIYFCCSGYPLVAGTWINDNGTKIISFIPDLQNKSRLLTFNSSGTLLSNNALSFGVRAQSDFVFSGDGTKALFSNSVIPHQIKLVDTGTGSIMFSQDFFGSNYISSVDLSYSGSRLAFSKMPFSSPFIHIYNTPFGTANQYNIHLPSNHPVSANAFSSKIALSDDGKKLAYGYTNILNGQREIGVLLWDITNPQNPVLLVDYQLNNIPTTTATGLSIGNNIIDLEMTPDGNRFVTGYWGAGSSDYANLLVFESGTNEPIAQFNTPIINSDSSSGGITIGKVTASVLDADISPDGTYVVATLKNGHVNFFGTFKELNTYYIGQ